MRVLRLRPSSFSSRSTVARAAVPALAAGLLAAVASGPVQAAVGARVLMQQWNPLTPNEQSVVTLVNDPTVVSDAVQRAWNEARPRLCAQLQRVMGRGGAAGGQTLRDITCLLDPTASFSVTSAGRNALTVKLAVSGYVEATSTTPTALGSYADPRFSLALSGQLLMTLAVQPDPNQTLRFDQVRFTLANATLDSHNFSGDVLKFIAEDLVPFFGGPNYKQMAENAINGIGLDIAGRFNSAMAPINAQLRGPAGAVRVGIWGKPDAIVVAFGPRELTPPGGGTLSGSYRQAPNLPVSLQNRAPDCASMVITASVQTGPAPLLDPAGQVGEAPTRTVGSFSAQPSGAGQCQYRLSNLAAGWPNVLHTRSCKQAKYGLRGDGWNGRLVTPAPAAERHYIMESPLECVDVAVLQHHKPQMRIEPGDPIDRFTKPGALAVQSKAIDSHVVHPAAAVPMANRWGHSATAAQSPLSTGAVVPQPGGMTKSALLQTDRVALNPQPLPPRSRLAAPAASSLGATSQGVGAATVGQPAALNWNLAPR